jgi:hypothetical protein
VFLQITVQEDVAAACALDEQTVFGLLEEGDKVPGDEFGTVEDETEGKLINFLHSRVLDSLKQCLQALKQCLQALKQCLQAFARCLQALKQCLQAFARLRSSCDR